MKQAIEELLAKYYEGETTLDEEKQLKQFFQQETIPAHLKSHAAQFQYFAEARQEQPSLTAMSQLAKKLTAPPTGRVVSLTGWSLRLAASVGLIILGFASGLFYTQWHSTQSAALVSTFTGDASSAETMKKVLAFEQSPKTSASDRIQAVNQSYELNRADQDITQLLINTLNFDANVNVRLAACQALLHFEQEPGVREALIQSLTIQTDPNVQITLIDMLVEIKEKRAVDEIQRLARSQQALDVVRLKAEEGLTRLVPAGKSVS